MAADGSSQALAQFDTDPTYQQLDQMLLDGRARKAPIFQVMVVGVFCLIWLVY